MAGTFIALEGIDGSGTTLQTERLARALRDSGHTVLETREPSDGSIGRLVRERLRASGSPPPDPGAMALLFAADRIDHLAREIEPALARGHTVVCDRYVLSSLAYQSIECEERWVASINARARWPDLTVLLRVPVDVALARVARRAAQQGDPAELYDAAAIQRAVAQRYDALIAGSARPGMIAIDGTASPEAITATLVAAVSAARP
jgi:dTMP kinase